MNYGFVKIAAGVPEVRVADPGFNVESIERLVIQAEGRGVEVICLPELSLTGYSCGDLFGQQLLIEEAEMALIHLLNFSRSLDIISIVGLPVSYGGRLYNCAAVVQKGRILGVIPKTFIPNYGEFYEGRWFSSGSSLSSDASVWLCGQLVRISPAQLFRTPTFTFGVELCEDLWSPLPPSTYESLCGAEIIFNLSADDDVAGKLDYLRSLLKGQSSRCISGYVYSSSGFGESSQDLVFGGKAFIVESGDIVGEGVAGSMTSQLLEGEIDVDRLRSLRRRNTTFGAASDKQSSGAADTYNLVDTALIGQRSFDVTRKFPANPFLGSESELNVRCSEIFDIQAKGLAQRLRHTGGTSTVVLGVSGGLDSTLALLVAVRCFDLLGLERRGIVGVTMPGFGTTDRTYNNAVDLMHALGVTMQEIGISKSVMQHFDDIDHDPRVHDVTYENAQARERTQILMDLANKLGGLVVGTGDMSELALGWCTYNGDHMSMYGVNAGVPKTLVRHLVRWVGLAEGTADGESNFVGGVASKILLDIVDTPISPELLPGEVQGDISQKTEDLVGPYELHDFFLYYVLRYGFRPSKVYFLATHTFAGRYDADTIKRWLTVFYRRFFTQQFKRSCMPDGPKVMSVGLSPRGDWRMPSDASVEAWLSECESL